MLQLSLALPLALLISPDRSYTIRGSGYLDPTGPGVRLALSEARVNLRDNREFEAVLFARGERVTIRGRWDRRGNGNVERIDISDAFGTRAEGQGTLHFAGRNDRPVRLALSGRTRHGSFHADIRDDDLRRDEPRRNDDDYRDAIGRGNRVFRNVDATTEGSGLLRMAGVRDGRFSMARMRLGTSREATLDISRSTRGTMRGEIVDIRNNVVRIQVREVMGRRASGELVADMIGAHEIERIRGAGSSDGGSWQIDFESEESEDSNGRWGRNDDRESDWPVSRDYRVRGSGSLTQDRGPVMEFDRAALQLETNRRATLLLDGRRHSSRFAGTWVRTRNGEGILIELARVNEMNAEGRIEVHVQGRALQSMNGSGQTSLGRFRVRFDSR
ncbi:MAG: hypothetical protein ACT4OZ_15745 [Gemmatimonadota bacterium]